MVKVCRLADGGVKAHRRHRAWRRVLRLQCCHCQSVGREALTSKVSKAPVR